VVKTGQSCTQTLNISTPFGISTETHQVPLIRLMHRAPACRKLQGIIGHPNGHQEYHWALQEPTWIQVPCIQGTPGHARAPQGPRAPFLRSFRGRFPRRLSVPCGSPRVFQKSFREGPRAS
jgi:hypothetical protein